MEGCKGWRDAEQINGHWTEEVQRWINHHQNRVLTCMAYTFTATPRSQLEHSKPAVWMR